MFNVTQQSERDLQRTLARHLIEYYKQFDIQLKQGQGAEQLPSHNQDELNSDPLAPGNNRDHPNEIQGSSSHSNLARPPSGGPMESAKSSPNQEPMNR